MNGLPPKIQLKWQANRLWWTELDIMNRAQDDGIVSDNCERLSDVAEVDLPRLVDFCRSVPTPSLPSGHSVA